MTHHIDKNKEVGAADASDKDRGREQRADDIGSRMFGYAKSRLSEQVVLGGVKLRKVAGAMKKTGNCFNEEEQRIFGEYVNKAADQVDKFASYLQDAPLERIQEDARDYSLSQPAVFMGACFSAGFILARVIKASRRRDG